MELHKAIKEIVSSKGPEMINNIQIINFLLDYQAFKEKPATKLILRDVINSGYAEKIMALNTKEFEWQIKFKQYQHDFIDSCGYKEELTIYVFEAIAYALGMNIDKNNPNEDKESAITVQNSKLLPEGVTVGGWCSVILPTHEIVKAKLEMVDGDDACIRMKPWKRMRVPLVSVFKLLSTE